MIPSSTVRTLCGPIAAPEGRIVTVEERQAYIEHKAPSWRPLEIGTHASIPFIGGAYLDLFWLRERAFESWREIGSVTFKPLGSFRITFGRITLVADMPDGWSGLPVAIYWYVVGFPVLLALMTVMGTARFLTDPLRWRLKRLALRLAWVLRPEAMDRKAALVFAEQEALAEHLRIVDAREAARKVAREAAEEAEIERRVAERMASLGVA